MRRPSAAVPTVDADRKPRLFEKAAEVDGGEVGPPLFGRAKEISGRQPEIPANHQGIRFASTSRFL